MSFRRAVVLAAVLALIGGAALAVGIAGGATDGVWVLHVTAPSGDRLDTTLTVPTTSTTTTTSSTTTSTTTVPPPGPGYPSLSRIDFDGDFDSGCQLVGGQGGWNLDESGSDHPGQALIERTNVAEGACSAKFTTPAGSGSGRSEVQRAQVSTPVTVRYEFLEWIPSEANNGPDHGPLAQTKMGNNGCFNGGLTLRTGGSLNFSTVGSCAAGSNKHDLGAAPLNRWFAVRVQATFADSGHVTVWIDSDGTGPAGYVTKLNVDTDMLSGDGLKLRQGLYHDLDSHPSFVYGDGFHLCNGTC